MEKDISKGTIVGLLILFGLVLSVDAQCTEVINCKSCVKQNGIDICLTCNDDFGQNADRTACCSKGCPTDDLTHLSCDVTDGRCATSDEGCKSGYIGEFCERCSETIQNCDDCWRPPTSSVNECLQCATNFYLTTDQQHCCPQGCDTCTGTAGTICTSCKPTYFLYNDGCDRCGHNCVAPADGSARCNPSDGECYLGCIDGWHGPKCDVECTLNRCERCAYDTDTLTLTCADCALGYYDSFCVACGAHCSPATAANPELCYQDGTCANGCQPGYRGNQCDIACDSAVNLGNCEECDRYAFKCTKCKPNYWGDQCQNVCNQNCVLFGGARSCSIDQGSCDFGCLAGYYKPDCSGSCPFCGNDVCDRTTGDCLDPVCDPGYYGFNCNFTCPSNCVSDFSGKSVCDFQYGNCTNGCIDGKWEAFCNQGCSVNCAASPAATETGPLCEQKTGRCLYQCKPGYFHQDCREPCESRCVDERCDITAGTCLACNETNPGYLCPEGNCPQGKRGNACEVNCTSTNCLYNQCGRYTDKCNGCPSGYYGDKCELTCSRCKAGTGCNQETGVCDAGCRDGWYRPDCETNCSNVCGSCERQSGECVTCAAGRWGTTCSLTCSSNCVQTITNGNNMVFCDKASGKCREQACKVGFWREDCTQACNSNCLQDENNNRICEYLDGECTRGCKDKFYGKTCSGLCSTRCRNQLCTGFEDTCDLGCADGYYGATCSGICSSHCAGQGRCDPGTGRCFDGCELGYYGLRCDDQCKNTCIDGTCNDEGGCTDCGLDPVGPNCRVQVCDPGKYGPTCESDCPGNYCLNNQCKRTTGTCETGCLENYYGSYCTEVCKCDLSGTSECEQEKGECVCRPGSHGVLCNERCSTGCVDDKCDRDGECSQGCRSGRYGSKCEDTCSNCLNENCNSANGNCNDGCTEGWHGPRCNLPCKTECRTCDIQTGECTSCINNYYSFPACDKSCSTNCNTQGSNRTCNQVNGDCVYGCKTGFYSLDCSESCGNCDSCNTNDGSCPTCNVGWWGTTCKVQCSSNCARGGSSNERMCSQSTGYCEFGCEVGYYGDTCSSTCNSPSCANRVCDRQTGTCTAGCLSYFYGTNCDQKCDNCKEGNCEQANGKCVGDCPANAYGDQCEKECLTPLCTDATCDRYSGYCTDCQISPKGSRCSVQDSRAEAQVDEEVLKIESIVGITVGSVAFVIVFVVVLVCCMNYKRRYDDAKTEIHLPSDVIERLSTHRSLHSTTSTNYPVARVVGDDEKDFVLF